MLVIATPFIDRGPIVHRLWLESFKRQQFDRKKCNLLWLDMTRDQSVRRLLDGYLDVHGSDWAQVEVLRDVPKKFPNGSKCCGISHDVFLERRQSIAETMQILNEHRGAGNDWLMWEDDIVAPPDGLSCLLNAMKLDPAVVAATGVQYARVETWLNGQALLIWDWKLGIPQGGASGAKELLPYPRQWKDERRSGWELVHSTATGFYLVSHTFLDAYSYRARLNFGQDIVIGKAIMDAKKKLVLCWDLKLPHLGINLAGRFQVFRSAMCTTEVVDADGTRF